MSFLNKYKFEAIVFFLTTFWIVLHWLANYPALYTWDFLNYSSLILEFGRTPGSLAWESFLYELYTYWMIGISPDFIGAIIFQILLFAAMVANLFNFLKVHLHWERWSFLFIGLFLLAPPMIYISFLTERDTLFVIIGGFALVELGKILVSKSTTYSKKSYLKVLIFLSLMTALRREAVVFMFLLPFVFFLLYKTNRIRNFAIQIIFSMLLIVGYLSIVLPLSTDKTIGVKNSYNLSAFIYSFVYLVKNQPDVLTAEDSDFLRNFFDLSKVNEIPEFDPASGKYWNWDKVPENSGRLYGLILRTFMAHPEVYFQSRLRIFESNLSSPMVSFRFTADLKDLSYFSGFKQLIEKNQIETRVVWSKLDFLIGLHKKVFDKNSLLFWISHPGFSLILLFIAVLLFPWAPRSGCLLMLPIAHTVIIFFLQPGLGTKYYYFGYMAVLIIFPILIWELKNLRSAKIQ